jgi:ABC-2 type transport system ATP-binding protein
MAPGRQTSMTMPALAAIGLRKRFNTKVALDAVDLVLPAGRIMALVGPNGAGKTTLIRVWLAFERPDSGRVEVDGVDPFKHRAQALRHIGYVPQKPAVYPGLSVADHLAMARGLRSAFDVGYARRRLDQLSIPLGQRADTLSGGQAAQLGLAIALGTRATILLLDEPLASLDPLARREFLQVLLDAVHADGLTALLSTHIVTDIEAACDRLAILSDGRILLDSPLEEARRTHRLTDSASPSAGASLIGSFASNGGLKTMKLWRVDRPAGTPVGSQAGAGASLEDVVLGYLAAGRGTIGLQLT